MKFGIGIPTLNRYDLLMPNLKTYARDFPNHKIYILDNGKQNIAIEQNIELIENQLLLIKHHENS
jgi:GT2 family glycosyltransferase